MAGDATVAATIGNSITNTPLVATSRFEFTDSPLLGVSISTGKMATTGAAVVGEY